MWPGLMISGFAKSAEALDSESYVDRAVLAAEFVNKYLYNSTTNTLLRSCYTTASQDITQMWDFHVINLV